MASACRWALLNHLTVGYCADAEEDPVGLLLQGGGAFLMHKVLFAENIFFALKVKLKIDK